MYLVGLPLVAVAVFAIMLLVSLLMRGPAYNHIDAELTKRFGLISRLAPWQKKILVAMVFVLAFIIAKQGIYELLKFMGMDVQQMLMESAYSMGG
jgi:hypothetical protein